MSSYVDWLAVSGSNVYAGGTFTNAGGIAANHMARWDGSSWSAIGSGMNAEVKALAVSGGDPYAGGSFTNAGGLSANTSPNEMRATGRPLAGGSTSMCTLWPLRAETSMRAPSVGAWPHGTATPGPHLALERADRCSLWQSRATTFTQGPNSRPQAASRSTTSPNGMEPIGRRSVPGCQGLPHRYVCGRPGSLGQQRVRRR